MSKVARFFVIVIFWILAIPLFLEAKEFLISTPSNVEIINSVLSAANKTAMRGALLYGLIGQETAYGAYLGKTEGEWREFCLARGTYDCFNWNAYDCKADYYNARYFSEILSMLEYDRARAPVSSTCAMGYAQF